MDGNEPSTDLSSQNRLRVKKKSGAERDWNLERHKIRQKLEQPEQPTLAQDLKQKRSKQ